jgi:hypothetical protein
MLNKKNIFRYPGLLAFLFLLTVFYSCNSNTDKLDDPKNSLPIKLNGEVLTYAPDLDITTCEVIGMCDCCSGNYLFINEQEFIAVEYCEADKIYFKGTYEIKNRTVILRLYGLIIEQIFDWSSEADTTAIPETKYLISERKIEPSTITLVQLDCEKNISFETGNEETPFAAINNNLKLPDLIEEMKADGVWEKLKR